MYFYTSFWKFGIKLFFFFLQDVFAILRGREQNTRLRDKLWRNYTREVVIIIILEALKIKSF